MRAIRFLEERKLADGRTFEKGSVHLLNDASALHFVKRDQAEFYTEVQSDPVVEIEQDGGQGGEPPQNDEQDTQDSNDGDSMEGSGESVEEPDGSDIGERPEPFIAPASNPAPTRGRSRGRGK